MIDAVAAVFVVKMQYGFGIAAVLKNMAAFCEFVAAFGVVIYLTVIDNYPIAAEHGLRTMCDVDYAKTRVAKADVAVDEYTSVIGASVMKDVAHVDQRFSSHLSPQVWGICN